MAATHFSGPVNSTNGFAPGTGSIETITASQTLTSADNGKTYVLSHASVVIAVTLPSPAAGLSFKFISGLATSAAHTIAATSTLLHGGINELEVDTSDDGPFASGSTTLTLVASTETVGDFVEMQCDGTSWFINGQTKLDGAVTFS